MKLRAIAFFAFVALSLSAMGTASSVDPGPVCAAGVASFMRG